MRKERREFKSRRGREDVEVGHGREGERRENEISSVPLPISPYSPYPLPPPPH